MTAFLYMAGRGLRLDGKFSRRPKVLLEFGGKTLFEWHLQRLIENEITEVVIVTGYERAQIAHQLAAIQSEYPIRVTEVVNPDFMEGSVLSFNVSLPLIQKARSPILVMDADVLYPAAMLRRLIQSPHATALLVDRNYSTADDDPVLVPIRNGRPFDFVKRWTGEADWVGESIGFFKIAPNDLPLLVSETQRRLDGSARNDSYDEVLRAMVAAGRFAAEEVTGLPWTEIDFPDDVARARDEVLPAIDGGEKKNL